MGMETGTREEKLRLNFQKVFGYAPSRSMRIVQAPGRVNLIGEHLDYNGGPVMPIAISRYTYVLAVPSATSTIRTFSELGGELIEWGAKDEKRIANSSWANYVKGVCANLARRGVIRGGFDIYIASDVPVGVGLSSSAALEVACAYAMLFSSAEGLLFLQNPRRHFDIARLCMEAEHEFAGVKCGLMDQVSAVFSRQGHVTLFDTYFNTREFIPFFEDCAIVVIDSGIRRSLADSRYNLRRDECKRALNEIGQILGEKDARTWRHLPAGLVDEIVSLLARFR